MMTEERVLAVEDETDWQENYKRWLGKGFVGKQNVPLGFDIAKDESEAVSLLQKKYYAVVIIDLVLRRDDESDRSGDKVQEFLRSHPEDGTVHLVVSGRAEKDDIRRAAYRYGAVDVLFKLELDNPDVLVDAVLRALEKHRKSRPQLTEQSARLLLGQGRDRTVLETKILNAINSAGGIKSWNEVFLDGFLPRVEPLARHRTRPTIDVAAASAVGLCWSRQCGCAISFSFAGTQTDRPIQEARLSEWLGFDPGKPTWTKEYTSIRALLWFHTELLPEQFELYPVP
jgi:CheY-like chemotaxis protein